MYSVITTLTKSVSSYKLRGTFILTCFLLLLHPVDAYSQSKELTYSVSAALTAATDDRMPFWLTANRRGRIDRYSNSALSQAFVDIPFTRNSGFDYNAGIELLGRASRRSTLTAHQLYGRVRYKPFQLTVGRVAHVSGITDTTLSVGSMMWSENAPPVPSISVSTPEFISIPGTKGWVHAKGYLAHGWMEPGRYVTEAYLHEKYFYLRLAPDGFPVHGYGGVVHNAIWGGISPARGPQRQSFADYLQMFAGYRPDSDNEAEALGNTVAIYDFALEWEGPVDGLVYRQFYIEDKPGLIFRSPWDGLWGLSLGRGDDEQSFVDRIIWEHVNTRRQGARYDLGEQQGADNYYNHSIYLSGWTYRGRTIGTPLLFSDGRRMGVVNNRLVAHHLGLRGYLPAELQYTVSLTYSRNYGARSVFAEEDGTRRVSGRTERRDQYSTRLSLERSVSDSSPLSFELTLAFDIGAVHPDNTGILLGFTYDGGSMLQW
jgi:hypothetical protein